MMRCASRHARQANARSLDLIRWSGVSVPSTSDPSPSKVLSSGGTSYALNSTQMRNAYAHTFPL